MDKEKDMGWVKKLLNNIPLLKFVRKFTADKLLGDTLLAEKYGIETNEDSISVANDTITYVLTSNSEFKGKQLGRYSIKQIKTLIEVLGDEGELIIPESENKEMIAQVKGTTVIVCSTPIK